MDDEKDLYVLEDLDRAVVGIAKQFLAKVIVSPLINESERKILYSIGERFDRLPEVSQPFDAELSVVGPRRRFEDREIYHHWTIQVLDDEISFRSGGHFYRPSTGGDSFSSFSWVLVPGYQSECWDYSDSLSLVDDAKPIGTAINDLDLTEPGFEVEVTVDGEPVADQETFPEDARPGANRPLGTSELRLAEIADRIEGEKRGEWHVDPPDSCDYCRRTLSTFTYFVDGKEKQGFQWGNMCPDCFEVRGDAIRWGAGQLYQQVRSNEWLMVGGFPPDDQ